MHICGIYICTLGYARYFTSRFFFADAMAYKQQRICMVLVHLMNNLIMYN